MIHNDIKPGNILISSSGCMKMCDFGLVQKITESTAPTTTSTTRNSDDTTSTTMNGGHRHRPRTIGMTTLNYRSPEVLFGETSYLPSMDIYATGVIFAELLLLPSSSTTLFHGTTEMEQLQQICAILGTPNTNHWPEYKSLPYGQHFTFQHIYPACEVTEFIPRCCEHDIATDLLRQLFVLDPKLRCTSSEAFRHGWFHNFNDNERQFRLLVQEELIPQVLMEPIIICHDNNNIKNNNTPIQVSTAIHSATDSSNVKFMSERENIVVTKVQALELAAKRRSFLANLDQWK
jgi:serine/threonine protein kinase